MFKGIIIFFLVNFLWVKAFSQQKNYANLLIGKWKQDSSIIINIKNNTKKLAPSNGYGITFEKSGRFLNNMADVTKNSKTKPLVNFASAKWKITNTDTVVINAIYALSKEYKERFKTNKQFMNVDSKNVILFLNNSILILETVPERGMQQKTISYFKKEN